ncbi:MAG: hypothetical protein ACK40O_09590 [Allosphingosinicella sp.]
MRNIDAYLGAAAYVLLSALMTAQALEPVDLSTPSAIAASAGCESGVELVMGCETVHL